MSFIEDFSFGGGAAIIHAVVMTTTHLLRIVNVPLGLILLLVMIVCKCLNNNMLQ
jgi:hypothetical protein